MIETRPTCDPEGVFSVKENLCRTWRVSQDFTKTAPLGLIEPVNPGNRARLKYTGRAIIDCWDKASRL